jgi:acyl-CoA synthetase (AMP-forming)/AMP-acid ligase II
MNLLTLLDMAAEGYPDRLLLGTPARGLTATQLAERSRRGARHLTGVGARTVIYIGENDLGFPLALFAAAAAGIPFLPLNYRLTTEQLAAITHGQRRPFVITDGVSPGQRGTAAGAVTIREWEELLADPACGTGADEAPEPDADDEAVLLMTSGTTAAPKSAVLRHRHLVSYILGSVEFDSSAPRDAVLVSVPPYHIAAVTNLISNLYRGRRIVYLSRFTAREWLEAVSAERVTHAMVVPTMLARIVDELEAGAAVPRHLHSLSYGGAPLSPRILARALDLLPGVGFVNAYGLTETSSSIAVLSPEDHRVAACSSVPHVRARLGSVGRPLPGIEIEVWDADGKRCAPGQPGQIHVRGPQVAAEYRGSGVVTDSSGWFSTRDNGYLDDGGYLFVMGRADDTIIRGGENIAPAEIESVIEQMPGVAQIAVTGLPSDEWGQQIGAFVVPRPGAQLSADQVRDFARVRLRSSKTPDTVVFVAELPHTATGKLLRRELVRLASESAIPAGE